MSSFILLCFLLLSVSLASPLTRRINQDEHVILANCLDSSNHKYSEMAYFPSAPVFGSSTTSTAIVNTPDNTYVTWIGNTVSATFSDGDTFTAKVVNELQSYYAGPGSNSYGSFNCFYNPIENSYVDSPNSPIPLTCSQVYDCSHAPVPPPTPTVEYFFQSNYSQFDGTGAGLTDFFNPIFQHFSVVGDNTACDQQPVEIPNTGDPLTGAPNCNIVFTCSGGADGTMVNSLAKALTQVVSTLPQMLIVKTVDITPYCLESGPIIITSDGDYPSQCLKMSGNTKQVSNIMSQMSMDVTNFPEGGNLEYTITCPQPYSCGPCDSVAQGMNLPSKIPIIGSFFGGIELGNAAVCNDSNCPEPL